MRAVVAATACLLLGACARPRNGGRIAVSLLDSNRSPDAVAVIASGFASSPFHDYRVEAGPDSASVTVFFLADKQPDEALHQVAEALMSWSGSVLRLERAQIVRFDGAEQERPQLTYVAGDSTAPAERALRARAEAIGFAGVEFATADGRVVARLPQGTRLDSGIAALRLPTLDIYECTSGTQPALAPGTRILPMLSGSAVCVVSVVPLLADVAPLDVDTGSAMPSSKGEPHSMQSIVLTLDSRSEQPIAYVAGRMIGRRVAIALDGVVCATPVVIGVSRGHGLVLGVPEMSIEQTMQLVAALRVCSLTAGVRLVEAGTFSFRKVRPLD